MSLNIIPLLCGAALLMTLSRQDRETPQSPVGCTYRAITLWQPWASLVALRFKQYETRSWSTSYRGKLLIHAAARKATFNPFRELYEKKGFKGLTPSEQRAYAVCAEINNCVPSRFGCIVAIADLTNCGRMMPAEGYKAEWEVRISDQTELELAVGDWAPGRYAWKLENIKALTEPIPCKGKQGLWIPSQEIIAAIGGKE